MTLEEHHFHDLPEEIRKLWHQTCVLLLREKEPPVWLIVLAKDNPGSLAKIRHRSLVAASRGLRRYREKPSKKLAIRVVSHFVVAMYADDIRERSLQAPNN
jgi:hypothetical protein